MANHQTSNCEVAQELNKMAIEQILSLRDSRDEARREIYFVSRDPVTALKYRHRAHAMWQALAMAIKSHGQAVFLTLKLDGASTWCVQVLPPDASEKYIGTFRTESEAQTWIQEKSATWLEFAPREMA